MANIWKRSMLNSESMSLTQWERLCYGWIIYTFCLFLLNMSGLGMYHLMQLSTPLATCGAPDTVNLEIYFITSVLFCMTFMGKTCLLLASKKVSVTSVLTLVVFVYGSVTHMLLFIRPNMFILVAPATNRCVSVIEILQWSSTCPLLYLSLFTSARKMTQRSATLALCEHLSIALSAISVFVPYIRGHTVAVMFATLCSIAAKVGMFSMFSPPKNTLDIRLLPYIYCIMFLYFAFPAIYIMGLKEVISQRTELGLFAFNDVIVKIIYAVLLEFCDSKIYLLNNTDLLEVRKRESIEKVFLRFIFHEARNPLSCISAAIEEIEESDAEKMYVRQLKTGMQSLERLLDDLKSLIENSSGTAHLEEALVNLPALLTNCVENIDIAQKDLFVVSIAENFPMVIADEYRLSSLFASCAFAAHQKKLDNSQVKVSLTFQNIGSMIDVHLQMEYEASEFSEMQADYETTSIKLRPETIRREHQLEYAFGLRLSSSIADMYMGDVSLIQGEKVNERSIQVHLQLLRSKQPVNTEPKKSGKRVLICDDNRIATRLLERVCRNMDLDCDVTYDGVDAVESVKKNPGEYFIIFMDIVMPKMSGVVATKHIHSIDPSIPIYGISANSFCTDKEELRACGARDCFSKPISVELIQTTIRKVMNERL